MLRRQNAKKAPPVISRESGMSHFSYVSHARLIRNVIFWFETTPDDECSPLLASRVATIEMSVAAAAWMESISARCCHA